MKGGKENVKNGGLETSIFSEAFERLSRCSLKTRTPQGPHYALTPLTLTAWRTLSDCIAKEGEMKPPRTPDGKFVPGHTGNPNGRPGRGNSLAELLRLHLDKEAFARRLCKMAEGGDLEAARLILSYIEPLPKGNGGGMLGGAVVVQINYSPGAGLPTSGATQTLEVPSELIQGSSDDQP
ncbi:MAG TPA: DUF5681 domain-containing protein [Bryobacteraceae bacterium]|nr:DUF5681 domain-containing protein [Bryobacteraceae bacterium]